MNRARQQTGRYSEQNFCAIPRPCAPHMQSTLEEVTPFERFRALQSLDGSHTGLIVLLHVPGSNTLPENIQLADYLNALLAEVALLGKHLSNQPVLQQLHVYGEIGLFNLEQLQQLFSALEQHLQLPSNNFAWFSIGIAPGSSSWATLCKLRDAGFNRITLSCNEPCFQATESLYEAARALQFKTITLRGRYRPDGSGEVTRHLHSMVRLQPDRIVLEHDDGTLYDKTPDTALSATLVQAGYVQVADSCFVLPDDELTENSNISAFCPDIGYRPVLGLGAGANSQLERLYYSNTSCLQQYVHTLTRHQLPPAQGCRL